MINTSTFTLIDKLRLRRLLSGDEYRTLLTDEDEARTDYLYTSAREVAQNRFGKNIYIRGLIEVSNHCRNNCLYCGIRRDNVRIQRYRLDRTEIIRCCERGYRAGFRTFVLQGGEDPFQTKEWVIDVLLHIRDRFPDCAITLSLGEKSDTAYAAFRSAGADRYLLRHETHNATHYSLLHPTEMSLKNRLSCLDNLREMGYQVGTGIMVGSPGQTVDYLVEDLLYIEQFRPEMIGIGPFIPHHDTPLAYAKAGSIEMTLKLIAIFRLMNPDALIPATTALATLSPQGRIKGVLAGANVVMPNLSPAEDRSKYNLYDNKAIWGCEAAEGLRLLQDELKNIGYRAVTDRGDYKETINNHK